MDKNAIKKYAVWARLELISRVSQKAMQYGITENEIVSANAASVNGKVLSAEEISQRRALIEQIKVKGYEQVMEEVAYTWFNRFIALRFMEVNGYLPSHVRVFTDEDNNFKPQILAEAINLELEGLDMDKVYALKDANNNDALFKYLIIVQCNALNPILPGMFQEISDYTELLFPDNLLRDGSVVEQMISMIPEEDWTDQVQIIGWLYQFYNIEPKAAVFAKNGKISKEEIPAATQLFTPDWIVRYMVENSLGRLWVEGHPNDDLKSEWKYYLEEAEQEPEVQAQLAEIRKEYAALTPEQIKCIDPCAGSGHILAYMFDVLMQIYETYGYTTREAVRSIIENNIYGLDIDDRAAQLAYFAVMMKARQYDRRFFTRKGEDGNSDVPQPHVYAIMESNGLNRAAIEHFVGGDIELKKTMDTLVFEMHDAKEYGSILNITQVDFEALYKRFDEVLADISIFNITIERDLLPFVMIAEAMALKYDIVVTNPPYLALSAASPKLYARMKRDYPAGRNDLYAVFMQKCRKMTKLFGYQAMITMHSWMFLSRSEDLRKEILDLDIVSLTHLGTRAFEEIGGEVVQTVAFVFRNSNISDYRGNYIRLVDYPGQDEKEAAFAQGKNLFVRQKNTFRNIPGTMVIYWQTKQFMDNFQNQLIGDAINARVGLDTGNNDKFIRLWHEVDRSKMILSARAKDDVNGAYKWVPHTKGGPFRKWYGNLDCVLAFDETNYNLLLNSGNHLPSRQFYFLPGITWSRISTSNFAVRYSQAGMVFNSACPTAFAKEETLFYALGLLNSKIVAAYVTALSPTMNFQAGDIDKVPFIFDNNTSQTAVRLVKECIDASKADWDTLENSWDFTCHTLVNRHGGKIYRSWDHDNIVVASSGEIDKWDYLLSTSFQSWENECDNRFAQLKANEEELNRIFIDIYGLQDELTPEVEDKDVTVRKADLKRDIKSLISYAVGCMFGRYSLDAPGLAYAGGEWDDSKYVTFKADKDNVIPICDNDYFEDDIVGRFVRFIEVVYGKETLDENLKFIADALGGSGQPKDVIRKYFMDEFYADHLKTYQKRPIYWLFDSGKKGGFRALIYMHRYQPDTIARIRTDYVHEQQSRYLTAIADLEQRIATASTSERVKLNKQLKKLKEQSEEIHKYEEKIHHLADQYIEIDLDDGVKVNYTKFQDVLAKIK